MLANVGLDERVEVASPQREILDNGPVQGFPFLAEDLQGGV